MATSFFDAVVCGPDLAGLVTAALLGRRGLRVLVCGHDDVPATLPIGGYSLPVEPDLIPPPDSEPIDRVLRELNLVQILRRRAQPITPALQLVTPDLRLDLPAIGEAGLRDLRREFGAQADAVTTGLARLDATGARLASLLGSDIGLPPDGFWERREVARVSSQLPAENADLLAELPRRHPMRAAVQACAQFSTGYAPGGLSAVAQARAFHLARRGYQRLSATGPGLRGLLLERIGGFSGEVRTGLTPTELVWRRGRVTGLRVKPRGETIGLDRFFWAGTAGDLVRLVKDQGGRKLREGAAAIRPLSYRYVLGMLVRPEAIPQAMGARVIAIRDAGEPLLDANAMAITVGRPNPRQPARVPLWIECLAPAPSVSAGSAFFAGLRRRICDHLDSIMPFFAEHLLVMASPHDGLPPEFGPADGKAGKAERDDKATPPPPVPRHRMEAALACDTSRPLQVEALPHATGMKNVYLVGAENLPGLGREGDFVSGWSAAKLAVPVPHQRGRGARDILIQEA